MSDLLIEIGTEEIPASYLGPAARRMGDALVRILFDARIPAPSPTLLHTPRRIAIHLADLAARGESLTARRTGPAARVAFDGDGNPTKAALGFARSAGVDPSALEVVETEKGPYVTAVVTDEGEATAAVVARALPEVLAAAGFPKTMRWTGSPAPFARPVRNLVALFGREVIPAAAAGAEAGRSTRGHPFLSPERFDLADAGLDAYRNALRERRVRVDPAERTATIREGMVAFPGGAAALGNSPELLREVVNLTEWPEVIEGRIDDSFLALPVEVLEVAMRVHLRFFPVLDSGGRPEGRFFAVMNRTAASADTVREGNERVLRARLTDARFFFAEDRKVRLEARVERLGDKGLHRDLGSYLDKTVRVEALVKWLAEELDASEAVADALRAARLAKADLVTEMVGEFPELQGTVGRIYAGLDGERPEVGRAIEDHYRPRGPEDGLPRDMAGVLVALADKLDDLAAFFHVGGAPTGSSDPFGLRRQALGLLRIVTDRELPCPLDRALARAVALVAPGESGALAETILEYVKDRFYQSMTDEGFRYDLIRAALGAGFSDPADCRRRVRALTALAGEPDWPRLVEVVERTCNITRGLAPAAAVDPGRLVEEEERRLYAALERHEPEVLARLAADDYEGAARHFVDAFADPVHEFFLKVFVNVDDAAVRDNRIALLARVNGLFAARIADLTRVEKGPAT